MPAYVLSTGKQKARLTASSGEGEPDCKYVNQPAGSNAMAFSCRNITMAAFASRYLRSMASEYIKEPVIDATGLEGAWDFDLHWTRRSAPLTEGGERTTIFDALDKQLDLSLILREAPAPLLVVDHLDKPAPNPPDIAQKLPRREPVFDVATLRIDKTGRPGHIEYTRGGIDASSALLTPMLGFAWDISSVHTRERMVGLPKGIESVYVEFNGKTADHTNELAAGNGGFDAGRCQTEAEEAQPGQSGELPRGSIARERSERHQSAAFPADFLQECDNRAVRLKASAA